MKKNWFDCIEELCVVGLASSGDDIDILKLKKGRGTEAELGYIRFLWGIVKKLAVGWSSAHGTEKRTRLRA